MYNIILHTGKFGESIRAWNRQPNDAATRSWINFENHFRLAHLELTETGELTLQEAGNRQANLVEDIVSRLSAQLQYHANLADVYVAPPAPPAPTAVTTAPVPAPALPTAPPVAGHVATETYLQQVLAQNQELMRQLMDSNNHRSRRRDRGRGRRTLTGPRTGQPATAPLPAATFNKYCWTHGCCNHRGADCNNKAPGHKDEATIENKIGGSCYACPTSTWQPGKVVNADNDKISHHYVLLLSKSSTVDPPTFDFYKDALLQNKPSVILKADTGATGNYIRTEDSN